MKINKIKAKVMTIARFNLMLKKEKENSELIAKAKSLSPDGKLPPGALLNNLEDMKNDLTQFMQLKKIDSENEKFPLKVYKRRESIKSGLVE